MAKSDPLNLRYRPFVDALQGALDAGDDAAFHHAFEQLRSGMNAEFMPELRRITESAREALQRFVEDTRLDDLAANEVPDARKRLTHVVELTDEAAHRTLDLVERSVPLVSQASREAADLLEAWNAYPHRDRVGDSLWPERARSFLERAVNETEQVRANLSEMLMAQGYQDLTGQIIRGVISLVGELETMLGQLVRLSSGDETLRSLRALPARVADLSRGVGPAVPGVQEGTSVAGQDDIDALLSNFSGGA
jgi:chemotaxis protein CheZ